MEFPAQSKVNVRNVAYLCTNTSSQTLSPIADSSVKCQQCSIIFSKEMARKPAKVPCPCTHAEYRIEEIKGK